MQYSPQSHIVAATLTRTGHPGPRRIRTLIVDDEKFAQAALQVLLRQQTQFEVVGTANNGPEAVQAIRRLAPELVFLDVDMPGLDGFEVLEQVRHPGNPAVIFTTANPTVARQAFDVGAVDFLLKPFTRARFNTALSRARARLSPLTASQHTVSGSQACP